MKRLKRMKHCCRDCHFLAWDAPGTKWQSWDEELRDRLEPLNAVGGRKSKATSGCYKGFWKDSFLPKDDNGHVEINSFRNQTLKNRRESCFFVEYQKEGLTWEAAEHMQRLEYENRNLKRGYRNTVIGLIFAGIGLVVGAAFQVANFFFK